MACFAHQKGRACAGGPGRNQLWGRGSVNLPRQVAFACQILTCLRAMPASTSQRPAIRSRWPVMWQVVAPRAGIHFSYPSSCLPLPFRSHTSGFLPPALQLSGSLAGATNVRASSGSFRANCSSPRVANGSNVLACCPLADPSLFRDQWQVDVVELCVNA
jgi:hypothetical protein